MMRGLIYDTQWWLGYSSAVGKMNWMTKLKMLKRHKNKIQKYYPLFIQYLYKIHLLLYYSIILYYYVITQVVLRYV